MTGAKFVEPPPGTSDWNRRLAHYLLAHQTANQDENFREWCAALCRSVRHWPSLRESHIAESGEAAHRECLAYAELHGAQYCEGLIHGPTLNSPELAIWAATNDRLVCFTHDLSKPHGLQGLTFELKLLYTLRNGFGITGPYLFSNEPTVMTRCIPRPERRAVLRHMPQRRCGLMSAPPQIVMMQ